MRRAALSAVMVLLASACRAPQGTSAEEPVQTFQELVLSQSRGGRPLWRLEARSAALREDAQEAVLEAPRMEFFKEGKAVSRLSALRGTVHTGTQDVLLSSSVVARSIRDGATLETEELLYSSSKGRFRTEREVLVKKPEGLVKGRGLEATSDLSEIRIFNQRAVLKEIPK